MSSDEEVAEMSPVGIVVIEDRLEREDFGRPDTSPRFGDVDPVVCEVGEERDARDTKGSSTTS